MPSRFQSRNLYHRNTQSTRDPEKVFGPFNMPEGVKKEFLNHIRRRLTPQAIKVRAGLFYYYLDSLYRH